MDSAQKPNKNPWCQFAFWLGLFFAVTTAVLLITWFFRSLSAMVSH